MKSHNRTFFKGLIPAIQNSQRKEKSNYEVDSPLTEVITLETLLKFSVDRNIEDIATAYSYPEKIKKNIGQIVWISPREPHPFLGEQLASGEFFNCRINSLHMRNREEVKVPKPDGQKRIFLIGASTAYSAGAVDNEETIGHFMEKELNDLFYSKDKMVEVFTAATPQWSSTHERILIANRLARLEPDLIVALSGAADIFWTCQGQDTLEVAPDWYQEFINHSNHHLNLINQPLIKKYPRNIFENRSFNRMVENYLYNIKQSAYLLSQDNIPLLYALQPSLITSRKSKSKIEKKNYDKFEYRCAIQNKSVETGYALLRKSLSEASINNFLFTDLTTIFDEYNDEHFFMDSFHFGDKGSKVIGENLANIALPLIKKD